MPIELASLSATGGTALCLDDGGRLTVSASDGAQPVEDSLPAMLPALERPRSEFMRDVGERARAAGLDADHVRGMIPEQELLLLGLRMTGYWATHALRWVAEIELSPSIVAALEELAREGPTQRIRHDAKRVLTGRSPKG